MYSAGGNEIFDVKMTSGVNKVSTASFRSLVDCWVVGDEVAIERGDYTVFRGYVMKKSGQNGVFTYNVVGTLNDLKGDMFTEKLFYVQDFNEAIRLRDIGWIVDVDAYTLSSVEIGGEEGRTGKSSLYAKIDGTNLASGTNAAYWLYYDARNDHYNETWKYSFKVREGGADSSDTSEYNRFTYQRSFPNATLNKTIYLAHRWDFSSGDIDMAFLHSITETPTWVTVGSIGDWIDVRVEIDFDTPSYKVYVNEVLQFDETSCMSGYSDTVVITLMGLGKYELLIDSISHKGLDATSGSPETIFINRPLSYIIDKVLEDTSWEIGSDYTDKNVDLSVAYNSRLAVLVRVLYEQGGYYGMMFDGVERKVWIEEILVGDE